MKKNYRNPMTRPENFMNPAGNVMKEIKEADLNNFSAGAGEPVTVQRLTGLKKTDGVD